MMDEWDWGFVAGIMACVAGEFACRDQWFAAGVVFAANILIIGLRARHDAD